MTLVVVVVVAAVAGEGALNCEQRCRSTESRFAFAVHLSDGANNNNNAHTPPRTDLTTRTTTSVGAELVNQHHPTE